MNYLTPHQISDKKNTFNIKSKAGFTIVEQLIALITGGYLLLSFIPGAFGFISSIQVSTLQNELYLHMLNARSKAVREYKYISVAQSDNLAEWMIWVDNDADGIMDENEQVLDRVSDNKNKITAKWQGNTHRLTFTPQGYLKNPEQATVISLCHANNKNVAKGIYIATTGRTELTSKSRTGESLNCES